MKNLTILWADDDADDLQLMSEIIEELHYAVHIIEVSNGKEALDYLNKARQEQALPSLIIMDLNMPVLNGKETLEQIKAHEEINTIPVVIFTTSNAERDRRYFQQQGVEMITKPAHYSVLKKAAAELLSRCAVPGSARDFNKE